MNSLELSEPVQDLSEIIWQDSDFCWIFCVHKGCEKKKDLTCNISNYRVTYSEAQCETILT